MRLNPFARRKRRSRSAESWLSPETKQAIIGIVLMVVSLIIVLSFFNQAGPAGTLLLQGLRRLVGWLAYAAPFFFLWVGYHLIRPREEPLDRLQVVGGGLAIIGLLGVFHLIGVAPDDALQVAHEGRGGGYIGFVLSFPLVTVLSWVVALLLFLTSFLIGVFMAFDISPAMAWEWLQSLVPGRGVTDEDEEGATSGDEAPVSVPRFRINRVSLRSSEPDPDQGELEEVAAQKEQAQKDLKKKQLRAANRRYRPPSLELLHTSTGKPDSGNIKESMKVIERTLSNFNIEVSMSKVNVGPTVTQFTLRPEEGTKLSRITALHNDLSLSLAAHPIRIEAPIPNTNLVGIEIPNKNVSVVRLRELLASRAFKSADSPLTVALGKDVSGTVFVDTLERMPHLLVAGATNSGKSVSIHSMLMSLLYRNGPDVLRMILVDPKRVELTAYNDIPHLLTPVITDPEKTLNALKWALREMDSRYRLLEESGSRNLLSYNSANPDEAKPFIVLVLDELADLMAKHAREVEGPIVRLSQMARAVGIHMVLATQRPSVNVITGLIKANVPARMAFNVASQVDSRTILDMAGAEKLLGSGDMLYLSGNQSKPVRLQGGFVSEDEVRAVVEEIKEKNPQEAEYDDSITSRVVEGGSAGGGEDADDELFEEAKQVVVDSGKASASLLQRRLRVGYARAARLIDMLEEHGIISAAEGNKPREVLPQLDMGDDTDEEASEEAESDEEEPW